MRLLEFYFFSYLIVIPREVTKVLELPSNLSNENVKVLPTPIVLRTEIV